MCNSCVENCEKGNIKVRSNNRKFIFKIESTGAMAPKEIFKEACEILENKTGELAELL